MTHKIVFINGPPGSGKDEAGRGITAAFPQARLFKLSGCMKKALAELFMLGDDNVKWVEQQGNKELPLKWANEMSWRQILISLSEDWAKPQLGEAIFGVIARRYLSRPTTTEFTAITDSGFREEALPIVGKFGAKNCLVLRLTRDGCSFDNDSRSFIDLTDIGVPLVPIHNHYPSTELFHLKVKMVLSAWLETLRS